MKNCWGLDPMATWPDFWAAPQMRSSTGGGNWACLIITPNSNVGHLGKTNSSAPCPMRQQPPSSRVLRMPSNISAINWGLSPSPGSGDAFVYRKEGQNPGAAEAGNDHDPGVD